MPTPSSYDYAIVRVVPRVEREEFINAGVILSSQAQDFLGARQVRIELDQDDLGHRQIHRACELAREQLGDQRLRPLAGAAKLEHVHAVVICLDDRGHRAALAERGDVARDGDSTQSAHCCSWKLNFRR